MKHFNKINVAILTLAAVFAILFSAACAANQSVILAESPEPTPTATARPSPTPSPTSTSKPTAESTPFVTPNPEPNLSQGEEIALLKPDYNFMTSNKICIYEVAYFIDKNGNGRLVWFYLSSPDLQTHYCVNAINYMDIFVIKGEVYGNPILFIVNEEITFLGALDGSTLVAADDLYCLPELYEKNGIEIPNNEEFNKYMNFINPGNLEQYLNIEMDYEDLIKFYLAATPKEYRVYAADIDPNLQTPSPG